MAKKARRAKSAAAVTTLIAGEEQHMTTMIYGEEVIHPTTLIYGEEHPTLYFAEHPPSNLLIENPSNLVAEQFGPITDPGGPVEERATAAKTARKRSRKKK